MVGTVIAPSLSGLVAHKDLGFSAGWLITLPSLGVVLFAPFIGPLTHRMGSLKLLGWGLIPYAVFGLLGAFITQDYVLIADRILLGAATAVIQVSINTYIADCFSGEARMKMIAWQGMAIELGGVVFLAIGGVLGEMHWQYPFYIYLLAVLCLLLIGVALPKPKHHIEASVGPAAANPKRRAKVRLIFVASLLAMMLFFVGFVTLPLYLPQAFGFSESETGYLMSAISVMAVITASQMPKMVKLFGDGKTVALGFILFMLGYLVLATATSLPFLIITVMFIGIGFGFTIPLLNHMMIEASTVRTQGKNLGLYSMGIFGGQFLSTFIEYISEDYTVIYGVSVVLALIVACAIYKMFQNIDNHPAS